MQENEEKCRQEAVRRFLSGEGAGDIARDLERSRAWVHKWIRRYEQGGERWYRGLSRAPHTMPSKTSQETERAVVEARRRLEGERYLQVGASSIQEEMRRAGLADIPETWTVNRILSRHGLTRKKLPYQPRGRPYPAFPRSRPNQLQAGDLVGPRYLREDGRFYSLNVMDIFRHKVGMCPIRSKEDGEVSCSLISIWTRLGIPVYYQMDNELSFHGSNRWPRSFGEVLRLCLALGVEPVFIPVGEPWRNGEIERFQDTFDRRFFRTQFFASFEALKQEALVFEEAHNLRHRYSCLKGRTPVEVEERCAFQPRLPPVDLCIPEKIPRRGKIHLIRFIRSNRVLDIFTEKFHVPKSLVYVYVVATIMVREQKLSVFHEGELVCEFDYELP